MLSITKEQLIAVSELVNFQSRDYYNRLWGIYATIYAHHYRVNRFVEDLSVSPINSSDLTFLARENGGVPGIRRSGQVCIHDIIQIDRTRKAYMFANVNYTTRELDTQTPQNQFNDVYSTPAWRAYSTWIVLAKAGDGKYYLLSEAGCLPRVSDIAPIAPDSYVNMLSEDISIRVTPNLYISHTGAVCFVIDDAVDLLSIPHAASVRFNIPRVQKSYTSLVDEEPVYCGGVVNLTDGAHTAEVDKAPCSFTETMLALYEKDFRSIEEELDGNLSPVAIRRVMKAHFLAKWKK